MYFWDCAPVLTFFSLRRKKRKDYGCMGMDIMDMSVLECPTNEMAFASLLFISHDPVLEPLERFVLNFAFAA